MIDMLSPTESRREGLGWLGLWAKCSIMVSSGARSQDPRRVLILAFRRLRCTKYDGWSDMSSLEARSEQKLHLVGGYLGGTGPESWKILVDGCFSSCHISQLLSDDLGRIPHW